MDSTYTIIIADDHPLFRNALFQSVHMAISGANLLEADSLDALLTLLNKESEPDLLLLDLKMPGANGMSGLIHLRSEYPDLPIVVISASEEPSVVSQVKSHGAFGFIPKSSDMRSLIAALNQVLNGEPYFPAHLLVDGFVGNDLAEKVAALTPQQYKVLGMLSDGLLNKQIAYEFECVGSHHKSAYDGHFPQTWREKPHSSSDLAKRNERVIHSLISAYSHYTQTPCHCRSALNNTAISRRKRSLLRAFL